MAGGGTTTQDRNQDVALQFAASAKAKAELRFRKLRNSTAERVLCGKLDKELGYVRRTGRGVAFWLQLDQAEEYLEGKISRDYK